MTEKTIKDWARIINESWDDDFDDDYEMRSEVNRKIASDQYREAAHILQTIDLTDEFKCFDFVSILAIFKSTGLDGVKRILDNKDTIYENKEELLKFFKLLDSFSKSLDGI